MTLLPQVLEERLSILLREEFIEYIQSLDTPPRACLRVNTLKTTVKEIQELVIDEGLALENVPWSRTGFWISERDHRLGESVEHFQGLFYLEDAASLLPPEILSPSPGDNVMDSAAAPGGKTTHLASLMGNRGALVANEIDAHRLRVLRFNLNRMGVLNVAVTSLNMSRFLDTGPVFNKVLLDAPCSCEGRIGVDAEALAQWSPSKIKRFSRLQRKMIDNCFNMLVPGGTLVYSTCTLEPEENEEVVDHLLKNCTEADIEEIKGIRGRYKSGLQEWLDTRYDDRVKKCLRLYPNHHGTQGFFIARIRKCR